MKMKLIIMQDFKPYKKDQIINVEMDGFWRRRIAEGSANKYSEPKQKTESTSTAKEETK